MRDCGWRVASVGRMCVSARNGRNICIICFIHMIWFESHTSILHSRSYHRNMGRTHMASVRDGQCIYIYMNMCDMRPSSKGPTTQRIGASLIVWPKHTTRDRKPEKSFTRKNRRRNRSQLDCESTSIAFEAPEAQTAGGPLVRIEPRWNIYCSIETHISDRHNPIWVRVQCWGEGATCDPVKSILVWIMLYYWWRKRDVIINASICFILCVNLKLFIWVKQRSTFDDSDGYGLLFGQFKLIIFQIGLYYVMGAKLY